jgi:hypothetical protein
MEDPVGGVDGLHQHLAQREGDRQRQRQEEDEKGGRGKGERETNMRFDRASGSLDPWGSHGQDELLCIGLLHDKELQRGRV